MGDGFVGFIASFGIYLFGINLGLSFIGAATAKRRGYSYGGFLCIGIFGSFLLSIIIAACLKPREGSLIVNRANPEYQQTTQYQQPAIFYCRGCGAQCSVGMAFCPTCGRQNPSL